MEAAGRLQRQIAFVTEVDKLKGVLRRASPIGMNRRENSAEHSWHAVLTAILLQEPSDERVDLLKVIRMLAVHDVVEIDVGDTFHFEKSSRVDLAALEDKAAERVFGLLPEDQAKVFLELWREFEARETPEAKFAAAIDRFMAVLACYKNGGGTWLEYDLSAEEVLRGNSGVRKGSSTLWEVVERFVEESVESGFIRRCEAEPQSV